MYRPIVATLGYVWDRARDRVLLVHRMAREDDEHFGMYNALGGKVERDEDVVSCMNRELHEEAGIEARSLRLRGTVSWPGFGANGEDWLGFLFVIEEWTGDPPAANAEGALHWVPLDRILAAC